MASIEDFRLVRLTENHNILPFDCGDADLNDFLINDAKNYLKQLLAVTYILEDDHDTVAFFSMLNDKISIQEVDNKKAWEAIFSKIMPDGKQFRSYPSVKLGRLGVSNKYQNQGIGTTIIDYLKQWFINNNRTGCMYLTVDAYRKSLSFYQKNKFLFMTEKDEHNDTRHMYYNLTQISD